MKKLFLATKASCMEVSNEGDRDGSRREKGFCGTMLPTKCFGKTWRMKMMRRKPPWIVAEDGDPTHQGVKTVDMERCCEFSGSSDVCLRIVTWNMNGQAVHEDVEKLVGEDRKFDLLVIGLQEAPTKNVSQLLENLLVNTHTLLGKAIMQSLHLYIFGPKNSERFARVKVDKHSLGGLGGLIGRRKGAVAICITYKGIIIQLISCHLAAHAGKVEERNDQFKDISESLFSQKWNPYARRAQVTVWLGDLNYRLQGINNFPARNLIHDNLHELLTDKDQLLQEAERGEIFNGYYEGALAFKPTYKYDKGSSMYDTSHKVRVPSWTDRILFKVEDKQINASLHCYESIDNVRSSDHKPVKAHLCLRVNK